MKQCLWASSACFRMLRVCTSSDILRNKEIRWLLWYLGLASNCKKTSWKLDGYTHLSLGDTAITLMLNMQNCFKDYKRCIHISYHILDFVQQNKTRFTMEQPYIYIAYPILSIPVPADALVTYGTEQTRY